jgi:sugar-specific transcriptional regulator TrmB
MIQSVLQNIGLDKKDISIYLMALELGSSPASSIARRVGIPRNTTRFILDGLVKQGLVNKSKRANTQYYTPEEPKNLTKILEMRRNKVNAEIDKQVDDLNGVMAELESKFRPESTKPKITFYEGEDGLVKVYEDTLTSSEDIKSFASFDGMHGALPEYFKDYYKRRAENNIMIHSIHPDTPLAKEKTMNDKEEWRESCLIPNEKYNFNPEIQFYDNKTVITSWKEKLGIIIESQEIYQTMCVAFDLAWEGAKKK